VGEQMEKLTTPVRTHWKHRLPTPSGEVQVIRRSDGTTETLYLASDHLGSVDAVLNASGTVLSRPSFKAWGARRGSNWQGAPSQSEWQAIANTTRRGYTSHEQLDNVMLVHLNGRVYDPAIGRFLSADPFIDCAGSTQGWNRYSYVKNSPLAFTDPSGYSSVATRGMSVAFQVRRIEFGPKGDGGAPSGGAGSEAPTTVIVTASRLVFELNAVFEQLDLAEMLRGLVPRHRSYDGGGGGRSGGDGAKQEEEHKECLESCEPVANSVTQTLAGIAGGGTTGLIASGNPGGMAAGAAVGGATAFGVSLLPDQGAARAYGGAVAGALGGYAESRHRGGTAGPGAIGGAIGEALGGAIGGSDGAVFGGAFGGAVGAGLATRANGVVGVLALGSAFRGALAGALGGQAYNVTLSFLNPFAESVCETFCQ